jgi:hypothetical protein
MTNDNHTSFKPDWIPILSIGISLAYFFWADVDVAFLMGNLLVSALLFQSTPNQFIKKSCFT